MHLAVDTLGQLLVVVVTPANEQDRAQGTALAAQIQEATGASVEVAFVDQGYTGEQPAADAEAHGIRLEVVKLPTPNMALCCCLAAGWSNAVSPGWHASGGRRATINVWRRRWPGCIS